MRAHLLTRDRIARQAIVTMTEQVADRLAAAIRRGDYARGDRLPSARTLAETYSVHEETASRALRLLVSDGLAVYVHGRGHFTA